MIDCSMASRQMPLYRNGTLDEGSRRELEDHVMDCPDCRRDWSETVAAWAVFSQHPSVDELLDIAEKGAQDDLSRQHIDRCPQCAEQLEMLMQGRTALSAETPAGQVPDTRAQTDESSMWNGLWKIAAGVMIVVLAGGLWITQSRRQETEQLLREATHKLGRVDAENLRIRDSLSATQARLESIDRPFSNALAVDILPEEMQRRGGSRPSAPVTVDSAEPLTLILTSVRSSRSELHRVSLSGDDGREIWSDSNLRMNPSGDFTLAFPPSFLEPGRYRVTITPITPPAWTQTYRLEVR